MLNQLTPLFRHLVLDVEDVAAEFVKLGDTIKLGSFGNSGKSVCPLLSLPLTETAVKGASRRFATANGRP